MWNCVTVAVRKIPPIGGKWIPFSAAEVIARRAKQMVVIVICTTTVPAPASNSPLECDCLPAQDSIYSPVLLTPYPQPFLPERIPHLRVAPPVQTPEPSSLWIFLLAAAGLITKRKINALQAVRRRRMAGGEPR